MGDLKSSSNQKADVGLCKGSGEGAKTFRPIVPTPRSISKADMPRALALNGDGRPLNMQASRSEGDARGCGDASVPP